MENRDDDLQARGPPARRCSTASIALIALALVATRRMWDEGGIGALVWLDADRRRRLRLVGV